MINLNQTHTYKTKRIPKLYSHMMELRHIVEHFIEVHQESWVGKERMMTDLQELQTSRAWIIFFGTQVIIFFFLLSISLSSTHTFHIFIFNSISRMTN